MLSSVKTQVKRGFKRFANWYRKNRNYGRSRKLSDHRALSMAERLICTGAMQRSRMTGSPLVRGEN